MRRLVPGRSKTSDRELKVVTRMINLLRMMHDLVKVSRARKSKTWMAMLILVPRLSVRAIGDMLCTVYCHRYGMRTRVWSNFSDDALRSDLEHCDLFELY